MSEFNEDHKPSAPETAAKKPKHQVESTPTTSKEHTGFISKIKHFLQNQDRPELRQELLGNIAETGERPTFRKKLAAVLETSLDIPHHYNFKHGVYNDPTLRRMNRLLGMNDVGEELRRDRPLPDERSRLEKFFVPRSVSALVRAFKTGEPVHLMKQPQK